MLHSLWLAMWPNIFAPSAFTIAGIAFSHVRLHRHAERRHEELKQHVTEHLKRGSDGS